MQARVARRAGADEFSRLHRLFVEHFGFAVALSWLAASVAATQAPWLRNIRGLIDPAGRPESTFSFLFGLPMLMALAWLAVAFGRDLIRRSQVLPSPRAEFAVAGAVAFTVFCLAVERAATAFRLA